MKLMHNIVSKTGCKIIKATNGEEAIKAMEKNKYIDLILMDLKMPVMDGFVATQKIRELFPDVPIIALTGYSLKNDKEKALNAGCTDILTKPLGSSTLYTKLINSL
jgi:CheY-like chemotaxis protein